MFKKSIADVGDTYAFDVSMHLLQGNRISSAYVRNKPTYHISTMQIYDGVHELGAL